MVRVLHHFRLMTAIANKGNDTLVHCRYAALVEDGNIKALNVEKVPSDFKVSDAETLLKGM